MLKKKPFRKYSTEDHGKRAETISLKINPAERVLLDECKVILEQAKDGTAIKQLMQLSHKSLTLEENQYLISTVFKNRKLNVRTGIAEFS